MRRNNYPVWFFVLVPLLIVGLAFCVAQFRAGAGMIVVLAGSTLWTAFVVRKGVIARGKNG